MHFLSESKRNENAHLATVVLPDYVPHRWREHVLHGQSAQFLKLALLFTPGFVVTSVPTHEVASRLSVPISSDGRYKIVQPHARRERR
jgi:hypothetical protein